MDEIITITFSWKNKESNEKGGEDQMQQATGEWAASRLLDTVIASSQQTSQMAASNHHHFRWLCVGVRVCVSGWANAFGMLAGNPSCLSQGRMGIKNRGK